MLDNNFEEEVGRMIIQSKTYGLTNNFNQLKVEVSEQQLLQFYRTMKKAVDKEYGEKRILPGFIDIHDHGWHGGDANHANHEYQGGKLTRRRGLQLLPTTSTTFPKTWNIHLK